MRLERVKAELIKILAMINSGAVKGNEIKVTLPCGTKIVIELKDKEKLKLVKND